MENELLNLLNKADESVKQKFLEKNESVMKVKTDYKKVEFDYSWLEKIEATIENLDNIVRNPKRFIIQEEEIVPIEKAKKITVESIRHLATHTNLIQDFDEKTGSITPSKILNINKEESFDIYENRFIYSLLQNLSMFIQRRIELTKGGSNTRINKSVNYTSTTKIGNEDVKISINLESNYFEDLVGKDPSGLDLNQRLERVQFIVSDFLSSSFIRELTKGNPAMVRSPIRKTNVILKNTDFVKALELWEFIERYDVNDKVEVNRSRDYEEKGSIKEMFDNTFLVEYLAMSSSKKYKRGVTKHYLAKIIEDFAMNNYDINEKEFKKLVNNEFKRVYRERKRKEVDIVNIYEKYFKSFRTKNERALEYLK